MSGQMQRFYVRFLIAISFLLLLTSTPVFGRVIYVDDDAKAPGDGKSWATAYRYLQDALADAKTADKPVEIRVAQGVYKPDQGANQKLGDRSASFYLMNGLSLLGGYAGIGVGDCNAREIELYETILSGDLAGNDVAVDDPCDLENEPSRAENSYHVVRAFMLDATPVLEGFTITAGNANGDPPSDRYKGGGFLCELSKNLLLAKCSFRGNFAESGGGMFNYSSNPHLTSCSFIGNAASGAGGFGGGIAGAYRSSPTVNNCTFSHNYAVGGGGISNTSGEPKFTFCDFTRNQASMGGAAYIDTSLISFGSCKFSFNSASIGGAAATTSPRCLLTRCLFEGNSAKGRGGGIAASAGNNITVTNCTFSGNASPKGNAFSLERRQNALRIVSSVLWDGGDEIRDESNSPISITYSNVFGSWRGVGNLDVGPRFADPSRGDYHLKSQGGRWDPVSQTWIVDDVTSPCIDAGDPNTPLGLEPFPNGGRINMGAYGGTAEASKSYSGQLPCDVIIPGDIDGDCKVDFRDLAIMAMRWLEDRTPHHVVTTTYRLVEDKSSVVSYCGRGGIKRYSIAGTFDLIVDFTAARATFDKVDVTSDRIMSFIDYGEEGEPIYTDQLDRMFHMTQLASTDVKDAEASFVFHKNIPRFPGADIRVTVTFGDDSVSVAGKFSDPMPDGCWHDLNAVAVRVGDP